MTKTGHKNRSNVIKFRLLVSEQGFHNQTDMTGKGRYTMMHSVGLVPYRCVRPTDGIQSLRRNYVSPSCPYLGIMPWRLLEARAPSCRPWPLYLAKMWPREQTKVIAADLASRRRTTAVLSSLSTSVSVALLTLKMYRHSVSIFFLLI